MEVLLREITKRIYTSIILFILFSLSLYNNIILICLLIFCFYQIFYEIYNLSKKIFSKTELINLYLVLLLTLFFLVYLTFFIFTSLNSGSVNDKVFLLLLITISISTDIGGYIFGKIFKGKKLTKISPNKTYSGMIGSFLSSILIAFVLFSSFFEKYLLLSIIVIVSTISQFGDIFISYLKRKSNVKDTGYLLPGHGGILDRFDGIIFAITIGSLFKLTI